MHAGRSIIALHICDYTRSRWSDHIDRPLSSYAADSQTLILPASNRNRHRWSARVVRMSASTYPLYLRDRLRRNYTFSSTRQLTTSHKKLLRSAVFSQDHAIMRPGPVSRAFLTSLATIVPSVVSQSRQAPYFGGGHGPVVTSRNVSVSYDTKYDNGATPLSTVACGGGSNGLMAQGYTDFASVRGFPYIGGADIVDGYNSIRCGECWKLEYHKPPVDDVIYIVLVDSAENGWSVSSPAMDDLTYGQGEELGRVDAVATLVAKSNCGMK